MDHLDWYQKEQEKKKKSMEESQIALLNRNLQRILKTLLKDLDKDKYVGVTDNAHKYLVRSSLWDLSYQNNFNNPNVAVMQALLIVAIAKGENLGHKRHLIDEADRMVAQLGHIDWEKQILYNQMKSAL